jgi:hypothetical protein
MNIDRKTKDALTGRVNVLIDVLNTDTGQIIATQEHHNLVVDDGLNLLRDFLDGATVAGLSHFALGTGTAAVLAADTALDTEVFRDTFAGTTTASKTLTISYFLNSGDANGNTLSEAGLFNDPTAGNMFARVLLSPPIVKTVSIAVTFTWTINLGAQ